MDTQQVLRHKIVSLALFFTFTALLVWRAPQLLLAPRFWAEEGYVYFKYAWEHSFWHSLLFVYWKAGYFYFSVNLATSIAAHLIPLEYAPFATTYTALFIQLIPFLIVLFGNSTIFSSISKKIFACLFFLFLPNITHHVWLNVLNSQVWLGLIAVLILLEDLDGASHWKLWTYRILLAAGAFSGVYVAFLWPIFLIKALKEGKKERYLHLAIVSAALLLNIGLMAAAIAMGRLKETEVSHLGTYMIRDFSIYHIGVTLVGYQLAWKISRGLGGLGGFSFLILFLASLPLTVFHRVKGRWNLRGARVILFLILLIFFVAVSLTAYRQRTVEDPYAPRYTVLSGLALVFLLLGNVHSRRPFTSGIILLLLAFSLITGMMQYRDSPAFRLDGGYWKSAVAAWREDPSLEIRIPPLNIWNLSIKPRSDTVAAAGERTGAEIGDTVSIQYQLFRGAYRNGQIVCSNLRTQPLEFILGQGSVISGLEKAIIGMFSGETKIIAIAPEEAFGHRRENLLETISRNEFPHSLHLQPGMRLKHIGGQWRSTGNILTGITQEPPVTVAEVRGNTIVLDHNHPLAGQEITIWFKLVSRRNTP